MENMQIRLNGISKVNRQTDTQTDTHMGTRYDGYLNKKLGIFAKLYFHNVNYTTTLIFFIDFILTYRSRRVMICKNITKKSAHPLRNKIQIFLNFWLIILKISYLQN